MSTPQMHGLWLTLFIVLASQRLRIQKVAEMQEKLQSVSSNQARMSASVNNMSSNATLGIL